MFTLLDINFQEHCCIVFYVDCPAAVTVTPPGGTFKTGDVLTCKSDGYPAPSYTWTDSNGAVLSTTSVARILTPGPFNWTCTAAGNFTTPCSASHSVIGNASGKKQTSRLVVKYLYSYFFTARQL